MKDSRPCDERHISALRWGLRYTLPPSFHLPAWHHAPALLIRLGRLEVHSVAAVRFGLVPAEDSGWKIYIKLWAWKKVLQRQGTVVSFDQGRACEGKKRIKQDSALSKCRDLGMQWHRERHQERQEHKWSKDRVYKVVNRPNFLEQKGKQLPCRTHLSNLIGE